MSITLFSLPNGQQIIGEVVEEDDSVITVHYPLTLVLGNPMSPNTAVYTARYMPMAEKSIVFFNKYNLIGYAKVEEKIEKFYQESVEMYKNRNYSYRGADDRQEDKQDLEEIEQAILKNQDEDPVELAKALEQLKGSKIH